METQPEIMPFTESVQHFQTLPDSPALTVSATMRLDGEGLTHIRKVFEFTEGKLDAKQNKATGLNKADNELLEFCRMVLDQIP